MEKKKHISTAITNVQPRNIFAPNENANYILYIADFMDRLKAVVAEEIGPDASPQKKRYVHNYLENIYDILLEDAVKLEEKKSNAMQNDPNKEDREAF
ncbi:MAG: hypothetical protein MJ060_03565 [Clostridia bacterium]|nr:hypothetical protein [Clostridia bacterium]